MPLNGLSVRFALPCPAESESIARPQGNSDLTFSLDAKTRHTGCHPLSSPSRHLPVRHFVLRPDDAMGGGCVEPISTAALAALILASRSGTEELGKEAGHSAWAGLARLRALVRRRFRGNDKASHALVAAEQHPGNEQAVANLRASIEQCAAEDSTFAEELRQLIDDARRQPEYQRDSALFSNFGYAGKVNIFTGTVRVQRDFNIN